MGKPFDITPQNVPPVETPYRRIKTPIPHPDSVPTLKRLLEYEPRSMSGQPPIVWDRAEGIQVHDKYGNMWVLMAAAKPNDSVGLALGGVRADGTVEPAKIIVQGQSQLSGERFGDYFAGAQDPVDGSVWLIGQYASTMSDLNDENSAGCKVVHVTVK